MASVMGAVWPSDLGKQRRNFAAFKSNWPHAAAMLAGAAYTYKGQGLPSHWNDYHRLWSRLSAPLRPDADVVAGFEAIVAGHADRVLLLGVTQELAHIGRSLSAVDLSAAMIAHLWPGDTARARAQQGNWLALPFADRTFTAIIGDGALSTIGWAGDYRTLFAQAARVLTPGGVVALRLFLRPDTVETRAQLRKDTLEGAHRSFHAFKWRLAMTVAAETDDPNVPVVAIRDAFNALLPDRDTLSAQTGWSMGDIETIDVYAQSREVYSFPTFAQLRETIADAFDDIRLVACGSYPLAERCPLLAMVRK
jgi:SAM-dependent methyltransferase